MNRKSMVLLKVSFLTVATLICGCRTRLHSQLPTSVDIFYRAWQVHDDVVVRSMIAPPLQDAPDIETLLADIKATEIISWQVGAIEPGDPMPDYKGHFFTTAKVPMEVSAKFQGQDKPRIAENQVDYWVSMDGKWFWYYTGFPVD